MAMLYNKPVLTDEMAVEMARAAREKAKQLEIHISVAIVDDGGNLKTFIRMDGSPLQSMEISQNKAYTAASFGRPTHEWFPILQKNHALLHGLVHTERMVIFGGGLPIQLERHLIGGIGISGGTGEEDRACAEEAIKKFEELIKQNGYSA